VIAVCAAAAAAAVGIHLAASRLARRGLGGDLRICLAAQLLAMLVRAAGLGLVAVAVRLAAPADLLAAVCVTAVIMLAGLALDVRGQLRSLRAPTEDPARA